MDALVIIKKKALEGLHHYTSILRRSSASNSVVPSIILPTFFKPIQDIVVVLVTFKNEEDPNTIEDARVVTALYIDFLDSQGKLTL